MGKSEPEIKFIRKLTTEVNSILGESDEEHMAKLKEFMTYMKSHPWFRANNQMVRWQPSKSRVVISTYSPSRREGGYIQRVIEKRNEVEQRKLEQKLAGKDLFEVPDEQKVTLKPLPEW